MKRSDELWNFHIKTWGDLAIDGLRAPYGGKSAIMSLSTHLVFVPVVSGEHISFLCQVVCPRIPACDTSDGFGFKRGSQILTSV